MLLAYDCIPLQAPLSGVGRYTHELARALVRARPDWTYRFLHAGRFLDALPGPASPEPRDDAPGAARALLRRLPAARSAGRWLRARRLAASHPDEDFDVYLEPNFVPFESVRARRVLAVVHDLSWRREPAWHPAERRAWLERAFDGVVARADRVLVDSAFVRDEAVTAGLPAARLEVVHPGCDPARFRPLPAADAAAVRARHRLPERFVLCVATFEPRKNLARLLDAWSRLDPARRRATGLVLVGGRGWHDDGLRRRVAAAADQEVHRLDDVRDDDLVRLLNLAEALVYPSLYEGFGLPPLEAMACGCPVVVSRAASLPEVCGEAALYFDPLDAGAIADALGRQLDERGRDGPHVTLGRARAAAFTWDAAARRVATLAERVAGAQAGAQAGAGSPSRSASAEAIAPQS